MWRSVGLRATANRDLEQASGARSVYTLLSCLYAPYTFRRGLAVARTCGRQTGRWWRGFIAWLSNSRDPSRLSALARSTIVPGSRSCPTGRLDHVAPSRVRCSRLLTLSVSRRGTHHALSVVPRTLGRDAKPLLERAPRYALRTIVAASERDEARYETRSCQLCTKKLAMVGGFLSTMLASSSLTHMFASRRWRSSLRMTRTRQWRRWAENLLLRCI